MSHAGRELCRPRAAPLPLFTACRLAHEPRAHIKDSDTQHETEACVPAMMYFDAGSFAN